MAERRATRCQTFTSIVRSNDNAVLADLVSNPGSTAAEVQASLTISQVIVDAVLAFGVKAGIIVARADFSGIVRYWRADTWVDRILTYVSDARTWADALASTTPLEGDLAADLVTAGLASNESEAVATALVNLLVNEGTVETA